jgi:transcriptional regulator with XRE-family HTH domain
MNVNELLKQAREAAGLSQRDMARRLRVPQQQVNRLEQKSARPTVLTVERWAKALGLTMHITLTKKKGA